MSDPSVTGSVGVRCNSADPASKPFSLPSDGVSCAPMTSSFTFSLNGKPISVVDGDPATTLSQWLRGNRCVGTKEGCAEGDCGACTVLVNDVDAGGEAAWR